MPFYMEEGRILDLCLVFSIMKPNILTGGQARRKRPVKQNYYWTKSALRPKADRGA
jgi:hypothetical protein